MKCVKQLIVSMILCVYAGQGQDSTYIVPSPMIEVFRPRGLRVSIPDYPGIRLFAFHGVVNRELNGLESGDLSKDILKKNENGMWVFEDKRLKLNTGDVLNYWLFVIKGNLGYRLDDQSYIVTRFTQAPPGFTNGKGHKTTTIPPPTTEVQSIPQYIASTTQDTNYCPCANNDPQPIPTCRPVIYPPTTHMPPTMQMSPDIRVWMELVVKQSSENAELRERIKELAENTNFLIKKLERIGDDSLTKLMITGKIPRDDEPLGYVRTVFLDKLDILDLSMIRSVKRISDNNIIIEVNSLENKYRILRIANQKLANSSVKITDFDIIVVQPRK